jgi:hypothetical protein
MQVAFIVHITLHANTVSSVHNTRCRSPQSCVAPVARNGTNRCTGCTSDCGAQNAVLHCEKILLQKESDNFCLMERRVRHPPRPPHPVSCVFYHQTLHAAGACLFLTDLFKTQVGKAVTIWMSLLIILYAAREFSLHETYKKSISENSCLSI